MKEKENEGWPSIGAVALSSEEKSKIKIVTGLIKESWRCNWSREREDSMAF